MDITVPIPRKNTLNVAIPEKNTITVDIVRKNTLSVQIDTPAIPASPAFVSAEVGLIDAYTIDMLFDLALNESKIPDNTDLIPSFSGGATSIYDIVVTANHVKAKTGLTDWYLPSVDELFMMLVNLHLEGVGGFNNDNYNSSTEESDTQFYMIDFIDPSGEYLMWDKASNGHVRGIRTFTTSKIYALRDIGPAGGWVFYITDNGNGTYTYLEAAANDSADESFSNITDQLIGTTGTAIGTGQANSTAIINQAGHTTSAALLCSQITTGRAITAGETGTIQYGPNADNDKKLQGATGAKVAAFTESVTNNVSGAVPVLQSITCADGFNIDVPYDIALDETSNPSTSAYSIPGHTITAVLVSGQSVTVSISDQIYWGDSVTLAYTKPIINMIKSESGGEAASFTATVVTNNVTQLAFQNANTLMWLLSEDLTTITKDGSDLVSRWNDRQASGRDLIQATGTNQPLWSSLGVLFDGVDNFMASDTFTLNQPEFLYMVLKQVTWTSGDYLFDGFNDNSGAILQSSASPILRAYAGTLSSNNGNAPLDTFVIIRVKFQGATSKFQINATAAVTGNFGASNMAGLTLGKRKTGAGYSNIQVKELIVRNNADDASTEAAIYSYLSTKYGI